MGSAVIDRFAEAIGNRSFADVAAYVIKGTGTVDQVADDPGADDIREHAGAGKPVDRRRGGIGKDGNPKETIDDKGHDIADEPAENRELINERSQDTGFDKSRIAVSRPFSHK